MRILKRNTKRTLDSGALKIRLKRHWQLYLLLLPAVIYIAVFHYVPMYGLIGAFKDFKPYLGYWGSEWVGFEHFRRFFESNNFGRIIFNTLALNLYGLVVSYPVAIGVALCVNYISNLKLKKVVQNITYAPYFVSTVVLISILSVFFGYGDGFVNNIREMLGMERSMYLGNPGAFRHLYVWSGIWQSAGWSSIIYISALANVDAQLHESAIIDGATILQRIRYIDLPAISSMIVTMFIMSVGGLMSLGFEKVYMMQNSLNISVSEVISTYVYKMGLKNTQYGYGTAVDIFNGVVNLILLLTCNKMSKKLNGTSIY